MLRKHQWDFEQLMKDIASREGPVNDVLVYVTPGGGKSLLPLIAVSQLCLPKEYKICWVVPRDTLRRQAERNFVEPFSRREAGLSPESIDHNRMPYNVIVASDNSSNPSRGHVGYITTYQAISADPDMHRMEFESSARQGKPYVLFLDECHHISDNTWEDSQQASFRDVKPLVDNAILTIYATGTLERHNKSMIAFLPYRDDGEGGYIVDTSIKPGWAFIRYSRAEALDQGAIVRLYFSEANGRAKWFDPKTGAEIEALDISTASTDDQAAIRKTILSTDYAYELIDQCVESWQEHKKEQYQEAKLLIVAPDIVRAEDYLKHIKTLGLEALIAHSLNDQAHINIERFKGNRKPSVDALVTVAMAYEGMDVKQITHVCVLTQIRSKPWIEQCICRANRLAKGKLYGHVFYPADRSMKDIMDMIDREQTESAREPGQEGGRPGPAIYPIPLDSEVTTKISWGDGVRLTSEQTEEGEIAAKQVGLFGIPVSMLYAWSEKLPSAKARKAEPDPVHLTVPSEVIANKRDELNELVGQLCYGLTSEARGKRKHELNTELLRLYGPRESMTISQLNKAITHIRLKLVARRPVGRE